MSSTNVYKNFVSVKESGGLALDEKKIYFLKKVSLVGYLLMNIFTSVSVKYKYITLCRVFVKLGEISFTATPKIRV